jgi:hypothetical protein
MTSCLTLSLLQTLILQRLNADAPLWDQTLLPLLATADEVIE